MPFENSSNISIIDTIPLPSWAGQAPENLTQEQLRSLLAIQEHNREALTLQHSHRADLVDLESLPLEKLGRLARAETLSESERVTEAQVYASADEFAKSCPEYKKTPANAQRLVAYINKLNPDRVPTTDDWYDAYVDLRSSGLLET